MEDAAAAEIDAELDAEQQTTESESEVEAAPVTRPIVTRSRSRIPAHIRPTSVRIIPTQGVSSANTQETPTVQQEAWVADMALSAPETEDDPEPEPQAQPDAPITGSKRNRAPLKTKGSITYNKSRGVYEPEYWMVTYMRCRRTFYSREAAEAALNHWKDNNVCPGCDRVRGLECEQCGHIHGDPIEQAQAPAPVPADPIPVADPIPMQIRCRAAVGTLTVTVNGVTFTVHGDFVYP